MRRTYLATQERLANLRNRAAAEDGVTVPEYMLVLGIISIALVGLWNAAGVGTAINLMSTELANLIN